jgi:hypothetical protein
MNKSADPPVQFKLQVANGLAVWSAGTPADLDDIEGKIEVENLMVEGQLNELLNQPFERALQLCPALQQHIESQEDASGVKEEFRQAWGLDGPADLRDALRAILDPAVAAQNRAAAQAMMDEHQSLLEEESTSPGIELHEVLVPNSNLHEEVPLECDSNSDEQHATEGDFRPPAFLELQRVIGTIHKMSEHLTGPEMNTIESGGEHSAKEAGTVHLDSVLNLTLGTDVEGDSKTSSIDDLLCKPFDEVLASTPLLKQYIADQPDAELLEQEFREHWGPDCEALRGVLEIVMANSQDPENDAWTEGDRDAFQMEMDKNTLFRGDSSSRPKASSQSMACKGQNSPKPSSLSNSIHSLERLVSSMDLIENQLEELFDRKDHAKDSNDDEDKVQVAVLVASPPRSRL